jgi:hypothetical protein
MPERCCAVLASGERCDGAAVVDDPGLAGYVCYEHAPPGPRQQAAIAATIRQAITAPDRYLAAALAEETDTSLAALLGCAPSRVWRLRLMGWPRADSWAADVTGMAEGVGADAERLGSLLRRLGA